MKLKQYTVRFVCLDPSTSFGAELEITRQAFSLDEVVSWCCEEFYQERLPQLTVVSVKLRETV